MLVLRGLALFGQDVMPFNLADYGKTVNVMLAVRRLDAASFLNFLNPALGLAVLLGIFFFKTV